VEQRNPTSARGGNRDVTLYSPYTHQWVTFPADSPLVASLPGYWIRVGALPEGPTNLRAPESESEAAADGNAPPQAAPMPANRARAYPAQLRANRAAGRAWENETERALNRLPVVIGKEITLRTDSGVTYRVDFLTLDPETGEYSGVEAKASETAALRTNQRDAIAEIARTGARIVGAGKPGFPGGTRLPPFTIRIVRPSSEKFMAIDQTNVVDFVLPDDRDGNTSLLISDYLPWDADELDHWYFLQEKVNSYLPYILDGQLEKDFPTSKGRKAKIVISAKYPLNAASRDFVEKLAGHTKKFKVDLLFHQFIPGVNEPY
jgi:hypothetical protein